MTVQPETLATLFTGLAAVITALAGFAAIRAKRTDTNERETRRRVRALEEQLVAVVGHVFTLELALARRGGVVPPRPSILETLTNPEGDAAG